MKFKKITPYLLMALPIMLLIGVIIYPFSHAVNLSVRNYKTGEFVGLYNFLRIFRDPLFFGSLRATTVYVISSLTAEFFLGLFLALFVHRLIKSEQIKVIFYIMFIIPMIVPPVAVGVTGRLMYTPSYGIINHILKSLGLIQKEILWLSQSRAAMFAVVSLDVWEYTPFAFLVFFAGLESIPPDIIEAAKIDGISDWQMFKYIELPYLKSLIIMVVIFRFSDAFTVFDQIMTLTAGGPGSATELLSVYIYRVAFKSWHLGYAAALSFYVLIFTLAVFTIMNKFLWEEIS